MAVVSVVDSSDARVRSKFLDGSWESLERGRPMARIWQAAAGQANLVKWHFVARTASGPSVWLFLNLASHFHSTLWGLDNPRQPTTR